MKKTFAIWISLLLFICLSIPSIYANETDSNQERIEIILQIGNDVVHINGEPLTIVEPYISNSATLVPLRVITESFGAIVGWSQETRTVSLQYEDVRIQLTIDRPVALINNIAVEMQTAAELKNGTTMVPIRFITENFGAVVEYEASTKMITITKEAAAVTDKEDSSDPLVEEQQNEIEYSHEDDKQVLGDRYYNWSINYPTRLILSYQSLAGDVVVLDEVNEQFYIAIIAELNQFELNEKDLLAKLTENLYPSQKVLDRRWVSDVESPYALIISKDTLGGYYEERAYYDQKSGTVYTLILHVYEDKDFEDENTRNYLTDLLDSFSTEYIASDSTKDVSIVEDGYFTLHDELYGITAKLPIEWKYEMFDGYFENWDGDQYFYYTMSSIQEGDTLEAWIDRIDSDYKQRVEEKYREMSDYSPIEIDGAAGLIGYTIEKNEDYEWSFFDIYVFKGDYKYNFTIAFSLDTPEEEVKEISGKIIESLTIGEVHPSIGIIHDDYHFDDFTN